jgi:hypothetical protein
MPGRGVISGPDERAVTRVQVSRVSQRSAGSYRSPRSSPAQRNQPMSTRNPDPATRPQTCSRIQAERAAAGSARPDDTLVFTPSRDLGRHVRPTSARSRSRRQHSCGSASFP